MDLYDMVMKILILLPLFLGLSFNVFAGDTDETVISVLPAFMDQVNAETGGNRIPWFQEQETYTVKIKGMFFSEMPLIKTVKGEYSYTLYKLTYKLEKIFEGEFIDKELTFFIERRFPTPESGIKLKELWPFRKDSSLVFKLRKGAERFLIVSIEK